MLATLFATSDRQVARTVAWLRRLGPSGFIVLVLLAIGMYWLVDMLRFVLK